MRASSPHQAKPAGKPALPVKAGWKAGAPSDSLTVRSGARGASLSVAVIGLASGIGTATALPPRGSPLQRLQARGDAAGDHHRSFGIAFRKRKVDDPMASNPSRGLLSAAVGAPRQRRWTHHGAGESGQVSVSCPNNVAGMQQSGIQVLRNPRTVRVDEPVSGFRWRSIQATRSQQRRLAQSLERRDDRIDQFGAGDVLAGAKRSPRCRLPPGHGRWASGWHHNAARPLADKTLAGRTHYSVSRTDSAGGAGTDPAGMYLAVRPNAGASTLLPDAVATVVPGNLAGLATGRLRSEPRSPCRAA